MKQVLFIQGGGEGTHDAWDNKLADSLRRNLGSGFDVRYPRMPNEDEPDYQTWKAAIAEAMAGLDDGAVVVAHSIGGTILISALAEAAPKRKLAGVFLIATPFVGTGGWSMEEIPPMADLGARLPRQIPVHLYHGSEDDTAPIAHVGLYAGAIPGAIVHRLQGRDHQLNDDLTEVAADIRTLILRPDSPADSGARQGQKAGLD